MMKIYKFVFLFIIISTLLATCWKDVYSMPSKADIWILGIFHFKEHDFNLYPQNIEPIEDAILNFKPDIFCVEWLPSSEENDLYNKNYSKYISELCKEKNISSKKAFTLMMDMYQKLEIDPDNLLLRAKLANYVFISRDFINACYQWYIIDCEKKKLSEQQLIQLNTKLPKNLEKYRKILEKHEISRVIFPPAKHIGISKIYSIDDRSDDNLLKEAILKLDNSAKGDGKLNPLTSTFKKIDLVLKNWLEEDRKMGTSTYIDKLNSSNYGKFIASTWNDFLSNGIYYDDVKFIYEFGIKKRNEKMFNLIQKIIRENPQKKFLILVGADHKFFLENLFKNL